MKPSSLEHMFAGECYSLRRPRLDDQQLGARACIRGPGRCRLPVPQGRAAWLPAAARQVPRGGHRATRAAAAGHSLGDSGSGPGPVGGSGRPAREAGAVSARRDAPESPPGDARANGPPGCSAGCPAGRPCGPGASLRATGQRGGDGCPPVMGRSSAALDENQGTNIYSNQEACRDGPGQTPLADHPGWRRSGSRLVPRHDYAGPERPVPRVPVQSRLPAGCAGTRPGVTMGRRAER